MLKKRLHYLQIALNSTLEDAQSIINQLPVNERIILEAGTPLLKRYGASAISEIRSMWQTRIMSSGQVFLPYIVADYKTMDRGKAEVSLAATHGAAAITVLGSAPKETLDVLIKSADVQGLDTIMDMMNVDQPIKVLRKLDKLPPIVMLHRGVDETELGTTRFPIHLINSIKGAYDVRIAVGGGDTIREAQSAVFNGADIVMVWKDFFSVGGNTAHMAQRFLEVIK